jgi:hypothetical protein
MLPYNSKFSLALAALFVASGLMAGAAPNDSPFLPAPGTVAAKTAAPGEYELSGMSVVGKETLLSVLRQSDKRSVWIPIGKTVSEITAVSYNAKTDEAVIRVNGKDLTIAMRKSAVVSGPATRPPVAVAVAPVSTPVAPAAPAKPMTANEEKETEARMLVTDLLEIGQQQRKAYEEAQRQAASQGKTKPPTPPAPVANH